MAWWHLYDRGHSGGGTVSEAPTSDVLKSWELAAPSGPGHAPVLSPCRADTGSSRPWTLGHRGCWQLLAISLSDLGIMSGQVSRDNGRPILMERGEYWQVAPSQPSSFECNIRLTWFVSAGRSGHITHFILREEEQLSRSEISMRQSRLMHSNNSGLRQSYLSLCCDDAGG